MSKIIYFYDAEQSYGEFSNFYESPFELHGITFPTVEHYFQTLKFCGKQATPESIDYAYMILMQPTAYKTKVLANQRTNVNYKWATELVKIIIEYKQKGVHMRSDWEQVKEKIMKRGLRAKFIQNPDLKKILLSTSNAKLVEHTNRDFYWADGGNGKGKNRLGHLLEEVRNELKNIN